MNSSPKIEKEPEPQAAEAHPSSDQPGLAVSRRAHGERLMLMGAWLIALSVVLFALLLGWRVRSSAAATLAPEPTPTSIPAEAAAPSEAPVELPEFSLSTHTWAITRHASLHTTIPTRPRQDISDYTITIGDSLFGIAQQYNIKPETILWANEDQLNDNPDMISVGMSLKIPPVDGVYYQWQEGDTIEGVAAKFEASAADILNWVGNKLDLAAPEIQPESWVMIPNGEREFRQWVVPVIPRGKAGVSKSVYGPGACTGDYTDGAIGTGYFVWPMASHVLSGNDFWSGHLGIDIAAGVGDPVYAADGGVAVFAGLASGGYGYMVMIDHGTGYQTLYAHLSNVTAYCGQNLSQGQYIGAAGSTGNSTGPHLHFEVRFLGGFINPWHVLPPP